MIQAKERLRKQGWTKGKMEDKDGRICLLQALNHEGLEPVTEAIRELYPESPYCGANRYTVLLFNDNPITEYSDVIRVLDRAIELSSE